MARDYSPNRTNRRGKPNGSNRRVKAGGVRRRAPTRRPASKRASAGRRGAPGWLWLICGLSLGLVVAIGVYIGTRPSANQGAMMQRPVPREAQKKPAPAHSTDTPPASQRSSKPRFAFYNMLRNYKVVIPKKKYRTPGQKSHPSVGTPGQYVIQVASFKKYHDADALKARLALLGIESIIQKATSASGTTWYRVRVGPSNDTKRLNQILVLLQQHHIDSLVLRSTSSG